MGTATSLQHWTFYHHHNTDDTFSSNRCTFPQLHLRIISKHILVSDHLLRLCGTKRKTLNEIQPKIRFDGIFESFFLSLWYFIMEIEEVYEWNLHLNSIQIFLTTTIWTKKKKNDEEYFVSIFSLFKFIFSQNISATSHHKNTV